MGSTETGSGSGEGTTLMEGWLYLIRSNRLGLQFSRKRYFVLRGHHLRTFKYPPSLSRNKKQQKQQQLLPLRSAFLDSCVRVLDNGRETINRKVSTTLLIHCSCFLFHGHSLFSYQFCVFFRCSSFSPFTAPPIIAIN